MKVRKKSPVYEALQWNKVGDLPKHVTRYIDAGSSISGTRCTWCGAEKLGDHGYIRTRDVGNIRVCPGDWVIFENGEPVRVANRETFAACYEDAV